MNQNDTVPHHDLGPGQSPHSQAPVHDISNGSNGSAYATGKGSRFAKFFDGKGRDAPQVSAKSPTPNSNFGSSSPGPGHREEHGFNGMMGVGGGVDNRAMDDLFAMLNNSAQVSEIPK